MKSALRFSLFFIALSCISVGQVLAQAELSPKLQQELNTTRQEIPVYLMLHEQSNAKEILASAAARGLSKKERVAYALNEVKSRNQNVQAPLVQRIAGLESVKNVRSRWIVNMIGFSASPERIRQIATFPEVAAIYYDEPWEVEQVLEEEEAFSEPDDKEPGLSAVNADKMWALGYTGFGSIGFTADTGVDPFHPALNHKYAGYSAGPSTWYDIDGSTFPFDCGDHGTHVTGTMLGLDRVTRDTIGVAYNSHWLGGAILCGVGTADNIGAFEWAIDPDGDFQTNDDRPTVINNSWRDPSISDIECQNSNPYPTILANLEAAGIAVVFSAGNSGPEDTTITPPHNINMGLVNTFTVGALNQSSTGIAGFSSRGPSICLVDSVPLDIKPEVSAPGSSVRSCLPGVDYGLKSGTSMAAPHVAGSILLLKEAFPDLDGESLKLALYFSAVDMGVAGEDNTFGRGIIDVFAAYNYLIAQGNTPTLPNRPSTAPVVMGMAPSNGNCGGEFSFNLTLSNEGIDEIESLTYEYAIDGVVETGELTSMSLLPGQMETYEISGTSNLSSRELLQFRLITANGGAVDPRLDIGGTIEIELSQLEPASLVMDDFGTDGPCLNSPILLSLDGTTGDSVVSYFSSANSALPGSIDVEQPFVIGQLTEPTTLYGVAEYIVNDGFETPSLNETTFSSTDDVFIEILANSSVRLRQATVIANESGRITVNITNINTGVRAVRRSLQVQQGVNRIELRASLESGEEYEVEISGNVDLGTINDNIRGEDLAGGRLSVTRGTGSFFLFDIESGYTDGCGTIEVELSPDPNRTSISLSPVAIPTEVELGSEVVFSETILATATDHRWIVSGTIYEGAGDMLRVQTSELGTMTARVMATDDNDCLATGTVDAEVIPTSSSTEDVDDSVALDVYPNPASDYFELSGNTNNIETITLLDAVGRTVQVWTGTSLRYDLNAIPSGAYLVQLSNKEGKIQGIPLVIE